MKKIVLFPAVLLCVSSLSQADGKKITQSKNVEDKRYSVESESTLNSLETDLICQKEFGQYTAKAKSYTLKKLTDFENPTLSQVAPRVLQYVFGGKAGALTPEEIRKLNQPYYEFYTGFQPNEIYGTSLEKRVPFTATMESGLFGTGPEEGADYSFLMNAPVQTSSNGTVYPIIGGPDSVRDLSSLNDLSLEEMRDAASKGTPIVGWQLGYPTTIISTIECEIIQECN